MGCFSSPHRIRLVKHSSMQQVREAGLTSPEARRKHLTSLLQQPGTQKGASRAKPRAIIGLEESPICVANAPFGTQRDAVEAACRDLGLSPAVSMVPMADRQSLLVVLEFPTPPDAANFLAGADKLPLLSSPRNPDKNVFYLINVPASIKVGDIEAWISKRCVAWSRVTER